MPEALHSPTLDARRAQMFLVLDAAEIEHVRRFGAPRRYRSGERLLETGKPAPGMLVVLSGAIQLISRDSHGHDGLIAELGAGGFSGEISTLSGKRSYVDGVAVGDGEALLVDPEHLRALMIAEAVLGEKIMRALILRRVGLLEAGAGGPIVIGAESSAEVVRLRGFLSRNAAPHSLLDPASDADARALIDRYAPKPDELPLVLCPDGSVLRNPTDDLLAKCIGMLDAESTERVYDVAIAGAGPAGLAAAVYAASEGLSVIMVDGRAVGGQAGASARIENYLGFPTGISGQALAGRAYTQSQKFGVRAIVPAEVIRLDCERKEGDPLVLQLGDGRAVRCRAVVIASGARYRRPECSGLRAMEGRGAWYWASPIEAKMCAGQEVVVVGGGNSAGQAAVFLSAHASKVWMLVRGAGLAASMSKYLVDRIAATGNIERRMQSEIVRMVGTPKSGLESVSWRRRDTGQEETHAIRHVFLFLGADPATEWLQHCDVAVDDKGFVRTGNGKGVGLETNVPGVFAIGDVRAGSVKRVGGAIGEGAAVVAQIHAFLARREATSSG